jgi:hypothetical protein
MFCPFVTSFTDIMRLTAKIRQLYTIHVLIIHVFVEAGEAVSHLNQVPKDLCYYTFCSGETEPVSGFGASRHD